ncbi:MAG TPA: MFS transporter [Polyangiaceae bacterium]|nr:MFS transporter [Polyangiaceae bacterium]
MTAKTVRHPIVWTILYLPFGALGGFVGVALTFLATKHGLSITEGALLSGSSLLISWLKWLWAPIVDVTLSPRRWYVISTFASAIGVLTMSVVPLAPQTLGLLLAVIALASLVNSVVGMAVEAMIAASTPADQIGRVSAWFQAGNLGGNGLGGALGLWLVVHLPAPWMAGAIMGALFILCCTALLATPEARAHAAPDGALAATKSVVRDLWEMIRTKGGLLAAILCVLPVGTGAASGVLTQAKVAAAWHAGEDEVALVQGLLAGLVTTVGCFAGGWLCHRMRPRTAYATIGLVLAVIAAGMAGSPRTVTMYVVWNLVYALGVGLAYAAFTAVVLDAMGKGSGATKYNVYASLSNFPIWWLGLLLGVTADRWGAGSMLLVEAAMGVVGVLIFAASVVRVRRSGLADATPIAVPVGGSAQ